MATINIRKGTSNDRAFITDSMRRTVSRSSAYAKGLHPEVLNFLLDSILATYTTLVATPGDSTGASHSDDILGYLLHDGPSKVAFVYVKEKLRRKGICNALLGAAGVKRGEVVTPMLVTALAGVGNFPRAAQNHGYVIRFRPWEPLQVTATLLGSVH
jgi:hypothetical protein